MTVVGCPSGENDDASADERRTYAANLRDCRTRYQNRILRGLVQHLDDAKINWKKRACEIVQFQSQLVHTLLSK